VRTNQDRVGDRVQPTADLEISVPAGSSIEAHGRYGDFDVANITGNVDITSDNAGVRVENIGGDVHVDTKASDVIRAVDVKGNVELKGRGDDVELQNIAGTVTSNGTYVGDIQLRNLAQPMHWEDPQDSVSFQKLPGQIRLSRGDLSGNNIIGPIRFKGRSSDVDLSNFTQSLDLTVERGDIDLKPGKDVPKMEVHTRSGDIALALTPGSKFDLKATTNRGDADNQYGDPLREEPAGRGATIEGGTSAGPELRLETMRGSVAVRKSGASENDDDDGHTPPAPPVPPVRPTQPQPPLTVEHQ
jgi:DUF4097 and DUF4098 domain-containing protein YvlB